MRQAQGFGSDDDDDHHDYSVSHAMGGSLVELREEREHVLHEVDEARARIQDLEARLRAVGGADDILDEDEDEGHDADSYVVLDHYEVRGLSGDAFLGEGPHSTVW